MNSTWTQAILGPVPDQRLASGVTLGKIFINSEFQFPHL